MTDNDLRIKAEHRSRADMRSLKNLLAHGLYVLLYSFVKYLSFPLSNYLRYMVLKLFSSGIKATYISDGVMIWFPWNVSIGRHSSLNQGCILDGYGRITIGEGVRIAPYTVINTADHEFVDPTARVIDQGYVVAEVIIEDDVWVGTGVIINKGVRIGRGSVIGSGSVVTKDIPPNSVAVGVPCEVIRKRQ